MVGGHDAGERNDGRMPSAAMMEPHTHREMQVQVMFPGQQMERKNIDMKYERERVSSSSSNV